MKLFVIVILVAGIIGGFVGGEVTESTFSLLGAVIGGGGLSAVLLSLGAYFHAQEEKKKQKHLPPEVRGVFDRMLGRDRNGSSVPAGDASKSCFVCGGAREPLDGYMCKACADFTMKNPNHTIHTCGGCGAGFQIGPGLDVIGFDLDGIKRELCACCYQYLKENTQPGQVPHLLLAREYDSEGQALNATFPSMSLAERLKRRENHVRVSQALASKARRLGITWPKPILLNMSTRSTPSRRDASL